MPLNSCQTRDYFEIRNLILCSSLLLFWNGKSIRSLKTLCHFALARSQNGTKQPVFYYLVHSYIISVFKRIKLLKNKTNKRKTTSNTFKNKKRNTNKNSKTKLQNKQRDKGHFKQVSLQLFFKSFITFHKEPQRENVLIVLYRIQVSRESIHRSFSVLEATMCKYLIRL